MIGGFRCKIVSVLGAITVTGLLLDTCKNKASLPRSLDKISLAVAVSLAILELSRVILSLFLGPSWASAYVL